MFLEGCDVFTVDHSAVAVEGKAAKHHSLPLDLDVERGI